MTYAAAQLEPEPLPETEEAPETGNRGWLAVAVLVLLAAAGLILRKTRKKSKKA